MCTRIDLGIHTDIDMDFLIRYLASVLEVHFVIGRSPATPG